MCSPTLLTAGGGLLMGGGAGAATYFQQQEQQDQQKRAVEANNAFVQDSLEQQQAAAAGTFGAQVGQSKEQARQKKEDIVQERSEVRQQTLRERAKLEGAMSAVNIGGNIALRNQSAVGAGETLTLDPLARRAERADDQLFADYESSRIGFENVIDGARANAQNSLQEFIPRSALSRALEIGGDTLSGAMKGLQLGSMAGGLLPAGGGAAGAAGSAGLGPAKGATVGIEPTDTGLGASNAALLGGIF